MKESIDARDEEFLRDGFGQELAAVEPGASPTDLIIDAGRRIRRRRHAAGGTLAILSAAGVSLSLVASGAFGGARGAVTPTSTAKPTAPASKHPITMNSAGYDTAHDLVGSGTIDGYAWHAALTDPSQSGDINGYQVSLGTVGNMGVPNTLDRGYPFPALSDSQPLGGLDTWTYTSVYTTAPAPAYYVEAGEVPSDVGSVVVDYADESLMYPVIVKAGKHLVAFPGAAGFDVKRISVYSVQGDLIAYSVPHNGNVFGQPNVDYLQWVTWHQPGRPLPPEGSVTFSGTAQGKPYRLRVSVNVSGVCADFDYGGADEDAGCYSSTAPIPNYQVVGGTPTTRSVAFFGYADSAVANVKLTLWDSKKTIPLTVVHKLGMTFFSGAIPTGEQPGSYTTYDAQGHALKTYSVDEG